MMTTILKNWTTMAKKKQKIARIMREISQKPFECHSHENKYFLIHREKCFLLKRCADQNRIIFLIKIMFNNFT